VLITQPEEQTDRHAAPRRSDDECAASSPPPEPEEPVKPVRRSRSPPGRSSSCRRAGCRASLRVPRRSRHLLPSAPPRRRGPHRAG
jgi:hypothetical protein